MDPIQLKLFVEALKAGDTRKAGEIVEKISTEGEYHKGYRKALEGMVTSVENKEANSLATKMLSGSLTKKRMDEERKLSKRIAQETFRPAFERGYEKAWYDILSIFLGKTKVGLEAHIESELY
ncbi:MAG: hypothetical protein HXS52_13805 [Theionarchaea archaeon]|nr:hypothetical protein [Theionarchaea archaeon]MBU7038998.1 hypothetical protein [Theionarchaea archaeon]